jgi:hypothetical protein
MIQRYEMVIIAVLFTAIASSIPSVVLASTNGNPASGDNASANNGTTLILSNIRIR